MGGGTSGAGRPALGVPGLVQGRRVRNGLPARSAPIVLDGPCPASTTASSGRLSIRSWIESSSWATEPPGRSVRPMEPANRVSPVSRISGRSPSPANRNTTEPPVWPGRWSTVNGRPARSGLNRSDSASTVGDAGPPIGMPASAARSSGDNAASGSSSMYSSAGMDVGRDVERPAELADRGRGVIEMTMGEHRRDRAQPMLGQQRFQPRRGRPDPGRPPRTGRPARRPAHSSWPGTTRPETPRSAPEHPIRRRSPCRRRTARSHPIRPGPGPAGHLDSGPGPPYRAAPDLIAGGPGVPTNQQRRDAAKRKLERQLQRREAAGPRPPTAPGHHRRGRRGAGDLRWCVAVRHARFRLRHRLGRARRRIRGVHRTGRTPTTPCSYPAYGTAAKEGQPAHNLEPLNSGTVRLHHRAERPGRAGDR